MDVEAAYRRSVSGWMAAVEGVDGNWTASTPCADWDVRQLVNHVVPERAAGPSRWSMAAPSRTWGTRWTATCLVTGRSAPPESAAEEAVTAVTARCPRPAWCTCPMGREAIAQYILQLTADHLIHGWDLAVATGQDRELDSEVVAVVSGWFADWEQRYRSSGVVAVRPESAQSGSAAAELLIAFGRDPDWSTG